MRCDRYCCSAPCTSICVVAASVVLLGSNTSARSPLPKSGRITLVDDYGHHPTEIEATVDAVRQGWTGRRLVLAFQPHRYTRTRDLMNEFGVALATADEVVLTGIYAASEEPIPGVTIEALADAVNKGRSTPVHLVPKLDDLAASVADVARPGDLVITLGAGSIASLAGHLVAELERRHGRGGGR